jgi:hypothetical protein
LVAEPASIPAALKVTGWTSEAETSQGRQSSPVVMAVEHVHLPIFGVQFHPESILSDVGYRILANFLQAAGLPVTGPLPTTDFASQDVWDSFQSMRAQVAQVTEAQSADQWPPTVLPQQLPTQRELRAP